MKNLLWDPLFSCGSPNLAGWPLELPLLLAVALLLWRGRAARGKALRQVLILLGLGAFWILPALERIQQCGLSWPVWHGAAPEGPALDLALQVRENRLAPGVTKGAKEALWRRFRGRLPLTFGAAAESRHISLLNKIIEQGGGNTDSLLGLSGVMGLYNGGDNAQWRSPAVRIAFVDHAVYRGVDPASAALAAKPFYSRPLFLDEFRPENPQPYETGNWTLLNPDLWGASSVSVALPPLHPDGWVYLSDTWYPGWSADVDGKSRAVLRAEIAFRAVKVLEGEKRLTFHFRPVSFYCGLGMTLFTLAFLAWPQAFKRYWPL